MAIAFVNRSEGVDVTTATSVATAAFNVTAGNLLWVWTTSQNAGTPVHVTDSAGNVYHEIGTAQLAGGGLNWMHQFYAINVVGNAALVITATHGATAGYSVIAARQWSGADPDAPLVDFGKNAGLTSAGLRTATQLQFASNGVAVAGCIGIAQGLTAGLGYTMTRVTDGLGSYSADEYKLLGTVGKIPLTTVSATQAFDERCGIVGATFRPVRAATSGVTVTLEAKIGSVWVDLSADRAHLDGDVWTITGGGSGIGPADLVADGGTFTFKLNNSATNQDGLLGRYSPNSLNALPGWGIDTMVRLGITVGNRAPYYKFVGWVDDILTDPGLYAGDQVVSVAASDWLAVAARAPIAIPSQQSKRGDQLLAMLAAGVRPDPTAVSFDVGTDTYPLAFDDIDPTSTRALSITSSIARSGYDRIHIKGDALTGGVLRFELHTFRRTFTADAFTLSDTATNGLGLIAIDPGKRRTDVITELRNITHPHKVDASDVVLYTWTIDPSTAESIAPLGGTLTIFADYVDPQQLAQSIVAKSIVAPVATTDYTFNSAANGAGTNLTASMTVTATDLGSKALLTIVNNHATLAAFPTSFLQIRGKGIYSYATLTATATSAGGTAALVTVDQRYQASLVQAQLAATYLLAIRTAGNWSSLGGMQAFCPASDETSYWTLLNAEVSTPFSVSETVSGLAFYPLWVNGWRLEIDERDHATFTFYGEPRDPTQYWSLEVTSLGELGITTYLGPF